MSAAGKSGIIFMGTPEFAVPCLKMLISEGRAPDLVITRPDSPKGRGYSLCPPPVKQYAVSKGLSVCQPDKIRTSEFTEIVKNLAPDFIITVAFGRILPPCILDIPRLGCINVHASLLPRHRGANPIVSCLACGDEVTGVTTMLMDEGMDTGDVLMTDEMRLDRDIDFDRLHDILAQKSAELLKQTMNRISGMNSREEIKRIAKPQPAEGATLTFPVRKEDARINWDQPASRIHDLVRGFCGCQSAWCMTSRGLMKIWKTRELKPGDEQPGPGVWEKMRPGQVARADDRGLLIRCGTGWLLAEEIQFASSKKMKTGDYLRGHPAKEDLFLGNEAK